MNLIVDVGNTFVKLAVFQDNKLIYKINFQISAFKKEYQNLKKEFPKLQFAIISSVGQLSKKAIERIKNDFEVVELSFKTKQPFTNLYKTPETLGVDRIALVSAAVSQFPKTNALIIDAGTCITYDFITAKSDYLGGAISPGIRLRYKSLNNLTANLPLLETHLPEHFTGNTTDSAIHAGVVCGVINEIDGVIAQYKAEHQDLTVILTGGDANFLSNQLKNSIFANSNFLLEGLNFILVHNSK